MSLCKENKPRVLSFCKENNRERAQPINIQMIQVV